MRTSIVVAGLVAAVAADYTVTNTVDVTVTSCAPSKTDCPANTGAVGWETWSSESAKETSADPSSTWAAWSSKSTADPSSTWGQWDPKSSSTSASSTWGEWDPKSTESATSTWGEWDDGKSAAATTTASSTWGEWSSEAATSTAEACPSYTASGPPEWFSMLPSSVLSSVAAKWTGAPPADWCYYSYSASDVQTSTVAVVPTPAASSTWAAWSAAGTGAASGTGSWAAWSATGTGPAIAKWTGAANANAGSMALAGLAGLAAIIVA